ncbi:MAG: elongation factor Ts [Erysipelotrichaceae bacterium]|nr:elongation factor Ts [Erysipelotrichaceae bacterium]
MQITASLVKELRDKTGAGMMDCKKALTECEGDIAKATDWLREKGISKAAKKSGRIAAEGLSRVKTNGNKAVLVEVNSETDFVAKNDKFVALLDGITEALLNSDAKTLDDANALALNGSTVADEIINATATIGEKISLRRFVLVEKNDDETFGQYMHNGGSISALAVVKGGDAAVAKDMAMQVASMNPQYISREHMDADFVKHEEEIQWEIIKNDASLASKPEKVLQGILNGRLSKSLQEISLVDQVYFKDQDKKVGQFLKENNATVTNFVRYQVGEGMEKREENFAEEVANAF